jgi:hypothetical protein
MAGRLKNSYQIQKLAVDLGLQAGADPVSMILRLCERKVRKIAREYRLRSLPRLLDALAVVLGTSFVEVHSDEELREVKRRFLDQGEKALVSLERDLGPDVYAITFKLTNRKRWQPDYVSVIDCRGDKAARAYFSKWHELAHLLTLTDQMRLAFTRTHKQTDDRDPEEALMEVIAGKFGFWDDIVGPDAQGAISFAAIERLRMRHCPEASSQAALIGFVKAWRSPCVLVLAGLGLKESEKNLLRQDTFGFVESPVPELRALKVTSNDPARDAGILIYPNMRVPPNSIVREIFFDGVLESEAIENLGWWTTSQGGKLADLPVMVKARRRWEKVEALIVPVDEVVPVSMGVVADRRALISR